jgi:CrcB protein
LTLLGVLVGGGLGALTRYHIGGVVGARQESPFPLATLIVNVAGSLLLGVFVGLVATGRVSNDTLTWVGVGFCGGLTTFSTFTYETLQLVEQGSWNYAWRNIALSGPLSFGAAALGYLLGSAI